MTVDGNTLYFAYDASDMPLGLYQVTIEGDAYVGAVGAGIDFDPDSGKIKITPPFAGVGGSYGVDFDFVG